MNWRFWPALPVLAAGVAQHAVAEDPSEAAREEMVATQIRARGVSDERVLEVMEHVPRHEFLPLDMRKLAYTDRPLPIGYGQTISQPYIVGLMSELLGASPFARVLEVGTGSGYQAAVLAGLVSDVFTIEIVEPLARRARDTLARLGYRNVHVKVGDGYLGWPEAAPFDAIIVTCAPEDVPQALVAQLREGGTLVVPVGQTGGVQQLFVLEKNDGKIRQRSVIPVRFVPMIHHAG